MKMRSSGVTALMLLSLASCGGGKDGSPDSAPPPVPNNADSYSGNYYYAEVTGMADRFAVPNLPPNIANQVIWNSIALQFDSASGTWAVAMNKPDYFPNVGHAVSMGPLSGVWTMTPEHGYQMRVTGVQWRTGNTGNVNPVLGGVSYDIFQPVEPTGWISMPANSVINICSASTNSVYTTYLGGASISCFFEIMDMTDSTVSASTIDLSISNNRAPDNS